MMRDLLKGLTGRLPYLRDVVAERDHLRREAAACVAERDHLRREAASWRAERERLLSSAGTVERFHRLYYDTQPWAEDTLWMGVKTLKCPLDLWVYQEILREVRPGLIIECGSRFGGSTLYLASICELLGHGRIVSIDIEDLPERPRHERIEYLLGSSTAPEIVAQVRARVAEGEPVMAILDSDHSQRHVAEELRIYSGLVTPGSYLLVEDTNINGHPVCPDFGPGPMEAVDGFLAGRPDFEIDGRREKFYLSFNPRGFLRRVR